MLNDIKTYFANFGDATNTCRTIALWITIAMLVAFIATRIYIAIAGKRNGYDEVHARAVKLVNGGWITAALAIAVCFIVTFAACYFVDVKNGEDYLFPILFYPLLVFAICAAGCAIALFIKPVKITKIVSAAVVGSAFIAVIVCMIVYYASGKAVENNWGTDVLSNIGLYLSAVVLVAGIIAAAILLDRKSTPIDTRTITYGAVCVALSFALSYVRIFKMPMGGSITPASMLPLMLFAFMFGSRKGVIVGAIYGLLQAIQDPWIIHPAQFALDYLVAFSAIGLTGCMRELGVKKGNIRAQFVIGACIACAIRFIAHYFAGVFAFGVYGAGFASDYNMPALANEYFYSFVYQCMYIIPELAIVIVAAILALSSKAFRKQIEMRIKLNDKSAAAETPIIEPENTSAQTSDNPQ